MHETVEVIRLLLRARPMVGNGIVGQGPTADERANQSHEDNEYQNKTSRPQKNTAEILILEDYQSSSKILVDEWTKDDTHDYRRKRKSAENQRNANKPRSEHYVNVHYAVLSRECAEYTDRQNARQQDTSWDRKKSDPTPFP